MNRRWSVFPIVLGMMALSVLAQWPTSPEQHLVIMQGGADNAIVSDGDGGAFVLVWGIVLQKLDRYGYALYPDPLYFPPSGLFVNQDFAAVTDGDGGIIFANGTQDTSGGTWTETLNLFRINRDGNSVYEYVSPCAEGEMPSSGGFSLASDSAGGAYIIFSVFDPVEEVRVQHVGPAGEKLWGEGGISLNYFWSVPFYLTMAICADRNYCYATVAEDSTQTFKLTPQGELLWGSWGIVLPHIGERDQLCPDGSGGMVGISLSQSNPHHLRGYRIDVDGNPVWGYIGLDFGQMHWEMSVLCRDSSVFVAWDSLVVPSQQRCIPKLRKMDLQGNPAWAQNLTVFSGDTACLVNMCDADGSGLVLAGWRNALMGGGQAGIYTQKFSYDGQELWDELDIPLSPTLSTGGFDVDGNGSGGAVYSWQCNAGICAAMVNCWGEMGVVGVERQTPIAGPYAFALHSAYPNPFNSITILSFNLAVPTQVTLKVFDVTGALSAMLLHNVMYSAGLHRVAFDGSDLSSGIYIAQLRAGTQCQARKIVLLK